MFGFFSKPSSYVSVPEQIYGTVVAQARNPDFFSVLNVPDSVMGRFDVLSLHVYLVSRRMKLEGSTKALNLSQEIFDHFMADIDRALRELGIGDTTVPKRKKAMAKSFYGQIADFDSAMDTGNSEELVIKVGDRFFPIETGERGNAEALSNYMLRSESFLSGQTIERIYGGQIEWPKEVVVS